MHNIEMPEWVLDRVRSRRGKVHVFDTLTPSQTCLIGIDLQNAFLMDESESLIPTAREIVPNVNRLASVVRMRGGLVVWIRHTVTKASISEWSVLHEDLSLPANRDRRISAMQTGAIGHGLWRGLDIAPDDIVLNKTRYSAFIQGSSKIEEILRRRNITTVAITGTVTNVCCESSARDAMMCNFKTLMVSDGTAARTDEEQRASLIAFYLSFGDVMNTEELVACLEQNS